LLLWMRPRGRDPADPVRLAAHLRRPDRLPRTFDRELELPLPLALLDPQEHGSMDPAPTTGPHRPRWPAHQHAARTLCRHQ